MGGAGAGGSVTDGGMEKGPGGSGGSGGSSSSGGSGGSGTDASADLPTGTGANGTPCTTGAQCSSGRCWDTVCCDRDCSGTCQNCNGAVPGTCAPAAVGTDPRNQCPPSSPTSCGTTGNCNGAGACQFYDSSQVCDSTASCDSNNASVIVSRVCSGNGACVPGTTQSCNGFLCSAGTCGTTCSADSQCIPGAFCSAATCVAYTNLAGNGDLETGTTNYWSGFGGGAFALSSTAASGSAHNGQYSAVTTGRTQYYQGPGYNMPTGLGQYVITAWGLQKDAVSIMGLLQIRLSCGSTSSYLLVQNGGFGVSMPQGVWTMFTGTVDTSTDSMTMADCFANGATPGLVKTAMLYLNQTQAAGSPVAMPDLYLDDVVIQVTDGHNLIGNPNFEAGFADGWGVSNGMSTLMISTTVGHGGTHSLWDTGRTVTTAGPRYALPIGAARYSVSFWVEHNGVRTHDMVLMPTYACVGGSVVTGPPVTTLPAVAGNTWTQLTGTVTFPPINATAGCKLSQASVYVQQETGTCGSGTGQVECPDLFLDDASVTIAP